MMLWQDFFFEQNTNYPLPKQVLFLVKRYLCAAFSEAQLAIQLPARFPGWKSTSKQIINEF